MARMDKCLHPNLSVCGDLFGLWMLAFHATYWNWGSLKPGQPATRVHAQKLYRTPYESLLETWVISQTGALFILFVLRSGVARADFLVCMSF